MQAHLLVPDAHPRSRGHDARAADQVARLEAEVAATRAWQTKVETVARVTAYALAMLSLQVVGSLALSGIR